MGWTGLLTITQSIAPAFLITDLKLPFQSLLQAGRGSKSKLPLWGSQIRQEIWHQVALKAGGKVIRSQTENKPVLVLRLQITALNPRASKDLLLSPDGHKLGCHSSLKQRSG